jgi:hypothetical protein
MIALKVIVYIFLWVILIATLAVTGAAIGWPHEYLGQWAMGGATVICGIVAAIEAGRRDRSHKHVPEGNGR